MKRMLFKNIYYHEVSNLWIKPFRNAHFKGQKKGEIYYFKVLTL